MAILAIVGFISVIFTYLGVNLVLSFTDQMGPIDWTVGTLNAVTLLALTALWHRRRRGA